MLPYRLPAPTSPSPGSSNHALLAVTNLATSLLHERLDRTESTLTQILRCVSTNTAPPIEPASTVSPRSGACEGAALDANDPVMVIDSISHEMDHSSPASIAAGNNLGTMS